MMECDFHRNFEEPVGFKDRAQYMTSIWLGPAAEEPESEHPKSFLTLRDVDSASNEMI